MINSTEIQAESSTLTELDVVNFVSIVRTSDIYKANPAFFVDLKTKVEALDGTVEAKLINAIITKLEALGSGVIEINQQQTVGTDGVVYSQKANRDDLINYALGIMYEGIYSTSTLPDDSGLKMYGNYAVGRLPLDYEGYI